MNTFDGFFYVITKNCQKQNLIKSSCVPNKTLFENIMENSFPIWRVEKKTDKEL